MTPTHTAGPAADLAAAISASYGRHAPTLQAEYAALCARLGIDSTALLTDVVTDLLDAGAIALPLELGNVGQFGPARLTARTAAMLAAANLLEARNVAGNASCEEPGRHVQDLCAIAAGWRDLALALASHSAMNDDNEGTDR